MQKAVPDLKAKCLLSNDVYDYHYVSQGKTSVPSIDDNEDLEFTHEAFNILHFTERETYDIYKCVSAVMNMGELKFKQKGREEQCEPDDKERAKIGNVQFWFTSWQFWTLGGAFTKFNISPILPLRENISLLRENILPLRENFLPRGKHILPLKVNVLP